MHKYDINGRNEQKFIISGRSALFSFCQRKNCVQEIQLSNLSPKPSYAHVDDLIIFFYQVML